MSSSTSKKKPIVVAGVPEHFNLPWHLAIESGKFKDTGIELRYQEFGGGTGAMMKELREREIDIAIVLSEGCVKDIVKGNPCRIVKVYVESPLIWGIHVSAKSEITSEEEIQGQRYAISRFGSGSHLMAIVDASERGWPTDDLKFERVRNLEGARKALANSDADIFLWEKFTTAPYVRNGEFRCVGERRTLWPAFSVCVREEVLKNQKDDVVKILKIINDECSELMANPSACEVISKRYKLRFEAVKEWFAQTTWSTDFEQPVEALATVKRYLKKLDLITDDEADSDQIWYDLGCQPAQQ